MQLQYNYDVIIIGSGPGGEGASIELTKDGARIAIIEHYNKIGGNCLHLGTIPSKIIHQIINETTEFNKNKLKNQINLSYISFNDIMNYANQIIDQQSKMRQYFYKNDNCQIFFGHATFIDKHQVRIQYSDNTNVILSAKNFIIACGSSPYHPQNINFSHPRIYDSDSILHLKYDINHIVIYGAGVIGCEYASIFSGMNIKVDLINTRSHLLTFLDKEISNNLSYHLSKNGISLYHNEKYKEIKGLDNGIEINFHSGNYIKADCLLYANGRTGNSQSLNLKNIGLKVNDRGFIKVNKNYQTIINHIYAVGDIIGYPSLASVAYIQGRIAAQMIISKGNIKIKLIKNIPYGIYTIPEVSSVGKTEQDLIEMNIPYAIGYAKFKYLARAKIIGTNIGVLKLLFHRGTKKILGVHCFGKNATELITIGQIVMEKQGDDNTIEYFINTVFNYPTMADAYRIAALNGLNYSF